MNSMFENFFLISVFDDSGHFVLYATMLGVKGEFYLYAYYLVLKRNPA